MGTINLLYKDSYPITDRISITIPKVGEVVDHEELYYSMLSSLTCMPYDMMVQLDDVGIDFTKITEYELFLLMFDGMKGLDTSMIFGDLDITKFQVFQHKENGNVVLYDKDDDIVIDRGIQVQIAATLRKINHLEKNRRKPGNEDAKEYLLKREREKQKRRKNRSYDSQLEGLIIAMVNTEQFKYDFQSVRDMTLYQFNESVYQVVKKVDYQNLMHGVYSGTVKVSDISQDKLNWLTNK